jgi:streptomycin 6-kinase
VADSSLTHGVWLDRVPQLVREVADNWRLTLGEPYVAGAAGHTVRAELEDGSPAVLKVIYPHREAEQEAEALRVWDGDGAVRLLAYDQERWAMLIERCEPGTLLAQAEAETALDVLIGLLPRLWVEAGPPFRPLAEEAAWWVETLPDDWVRAGRPFERRLVDAAVDSLMTLADSQGEHVLLHQDLHGDNVLAAKREPWLVIDPKPLAGEREFGVAPIVRDPELGHSKHDVLHRLERLTSELGLDRERARGWTVGQTIAWSFDTSYRDQHAQTVRWLLESA